MLLAPSFDISLTAWALAFTAAIVIGLSKAGIKGIAIINVTLMALAFDAKASTGIVVPLLVVGDIFAVIYYNRHANWLHIAKFLPWILFGILIGVFIGNDLNETLFKIAMAIIILMSVIMMYWWDRRKSKRVPTHWAFAGFVGTIAGITTMIGNLGGAFSNIYFLAMRVQKNEFIGTAAWLFLIINVIKLPFHIFVWETVTMETLMFDLKLVPGIFLGVFLGIRLVKIIKEDFYRKMILVLTALGAFMILIK
ncbi:MULTISPECIES: sulfite exporter TauE/SafE family protein [Bacteroidota]|uniref:Probable membrane transporter protein n=1 Tax=Euzebyella saccharophila TaxID=679664 RepID=A0ABV8JT59_9FLAO|nr:MULTISPECIES: sulfite exporter TauE/SafE family protein [Bacteroidota]MBC6999108.1 sulfite exporter TauE/SafE family protein [Cytophaga sp. FL35]